MKTRYKFIHFKEVADGVQERTWMCLTNRDKDFIGCVGYLVPWKQYVYRPAGNTEYSHDCLTDISHFMRELNEQPNEKV